VAEALANAGKHAAPTKVEVSLARSNGSLQLVISDDGSGFDPAQAVGAGLVNLAERLTALGGRLDVASRPGGGTTITAQLSIADV
jgi:signal transduction histidine kinase